MRIAATILALFLCVLPRASLPAQSTPLKIEVDMLFDLHSDEVMAMLNELLVERFDTAVKAARDAAHC